MYVKMVVPGQMDNNMFTIKLSAKEMLNLIHGYTVFTPSFPRRSEHNALLYEHMAHLYYDLVARHKRGQARKKPQRTYTLKFAGADSLAFFQAWGIIDTSAMPLTTVIIGKIIAKMHQEHIHLHKQLLTSKNTLC